MIGYLSHLPPSPQPSPVKGEGVSGSIKENWEWI
jgi:hypothetical protein